MENTQATTDIAAFERYQKRLRKRFRLEERELAALQSKVIEKRVELWQLQVKSEVWSGIAYPKPPATTHKVKKYATDIPLKPGVYFIWDGEEIVYVGQSKRLQQRVTLQHENIQEGNEVSTLLFPIEILDFAEAYYIGTLCPVRNFGGRAAKRLTALSECCYPNTGDSTRNWTACHQ